MPRHAWEALLRSSHPAAVVIWPCDDHGSEVRSELSLSASHGNIRAVDRDFSCPSQGSTERLVKEAEL